LGWADFRRRVLGSRRRWLIWSPALFAVALVSPANFSALIHTGMGGGALGVVLFGLAGGYALAGRGRVWLRVLAGVVALAGILVMGSMTLDLYPAATARGAWVGLYAASLVAVFCVACSLTQRPAPEPRLIPLVGAGALVGLAWASALRCLLTQLDGPAAEVRWAGTFLGVLLPGVVTGALLGWAEHVRSTGGRRYGRWLTLAPLVLVAVLVGNLRPPGSGAGPGLALDTPHGAWVAVLALGLLATLAFAAAIPHRQARPLPSR
jgi:hypothetical protein